MIVTVFRSRLKADANPAYEETAERMSALARSMPGYVSHKTFVADDGERVTLVEFADAPSQAAWSRHVEHVQAQQRGRRDFYSEYTLQVCRIERESRYCAP